MRRQKRTIIANRSRQAQAMLLCVLGGAGAVRAQSVLAPLPSHSVTPPAVAADQAENGAVRSWLETVTELSPADFLLWGPVTVRPHLDYSVNYSTGLQAQPGQPSSSVVQQVSPGALFIIGTHWTLDYNPELVFYSSSQLRDSVNQSAVLTWGSHYEDWNLNLSQSYASSSDPQVQTATQTDTEQFSTSFEASYAFNSELSLDTTLTQSINSADQFSSSRSWSIMDFLDYQFYRRITIGIGGGGGYDQVNDGPDMSHETVQLRLGWQVSNKLQMNVHGGVEDRQFLHSDEGNLISPTYGASIIYNPFTFTTIDLSLDRSISPAISTGAQASDTTSLSVTWSQRLLKRLQLSVNGTYTQSDYINSVDPNTVPFASLLGFVPNRSDTYYVFTSRLSFSMLRRVQISGSYTYSENMSTAAGFGYSSSQVGVDVSYRY